MKCPFCSHPDSKVIDSRDSKEGEVIRRRRQCENCGKRFTSYERIEEVPLMVIKKDGTHEIFDPNKIAKGILKSTEKRKVSRSDIEEIVIDIEQKIHQNPDKEFLTQDMRIREW